MKLLSNLRKDKKGFTLIEIVIVLAIAALILVIVFLAVQGAQKSQRDNAAKQGASRAVAAAQSYLSDNENKLTTIATDAPATCDLSGSTSACNFGKYFTDVVGHTNKTFRYGTTAVTQAGNPMISFGQTCVAGVMSTTGAGPTSVAAVYWSETANKPVCVGS